MHADMSRQFLLCFSILCTQICHRQCRDANC